MGEKNKIAIVVNHKDICRIIPFNSSDGEYEVKIEFLGNQYSLNMFPLFNKEPLKLSNFESNELELTYHKSNFGKTPKIHLKRKIKNKGENQYENLPLNHLVSPNVNQVFPMPLFKLEIPLSKIQRNYKPKKDHVLLSPDNCNVIEIYLIHKSFDLEKFYTRFPAVHLALTMLPFEIFATNSVLTGNQKYENIMPRNDTQTISTSFELFDDMRIIANHYYNPELDKKLSNVHVTFIDNQLSEAILAMTRVIYPSESSNGVYDNVYLGTSNLHHLDTPLHPLLRPFIDESTLILDSIKRGKLDVREKDRYYWIALEMKKELLKAMKANVVLV